MSRCPRGIRGCQCGALYCGGDHKPDQSGLDDGPLLHAPRKRPAPKMPAEYRDIRAAAWATRRAKYGESGHG